MSRGKWLACAWQDCGRIFAPIRPEQTYCSRECARRAEQKARQPTRQQQIDALMLAIRRELERIIK